MDEYLDKRRALLTGLSPLGLDSRPKRQSFTRTSPHTCSGCDLTITEEDCIKGAYKISLGTVSSAILAAAAGCAFFEWVVDLLVWPASEDAHRTFKPTKQHVLYLDFPDAGSDEPFVSVTCGDGQGASGAVRLHERGWWTGRLFVCAMVGDPAAGAVKTRPHESDVTSEKSMQFARRCLRECEMNHKCTSTSLKQTGKATDPEAIPTRLLRIPGQGATAVVTLVEASNLGNGEIDQICVKGWTCLTYCWGDQDQPLTLTHDTLPALRQGVSVDKLSQALRDAVKVTALLDMEYLWVDALCILQDDPHDKEVEVSNMWWLYGENTVTLCAASTASSSEGFLDQRAEPEYAAGPFKIGVDTGGSLGSILLYDAIEPYDPITRRAWALQETLGSCRMLIFSSTQLHWCCRAATAACGGPYTSLRGSRSRVRQASVPGIRTFDPLKKQLLHFQWHRLVAEYTHRSLGRPGDKLLAISALAAGMSWEFARAGLPVTYLAGLFVNFADKVDWTRQLLWRVVPDQTQRAREWRAPSWSWACLDGPISDVYQEWYSVGPNWRFEHDIRCGIVSETLELVLPSNRFGSLKSASMTFHGRLRLLDVSVGLPRQLVWTERALSGFQNPEETYVALLPDTAEDRPLIEESLLGKTDIFCLEVIPYTEAKAAPVGLLLARSAEESEESYMRVGMFIFHVGTGQQAGRRGPDPRQTFFQDVEFRRHLLR